jgi:hypothetical protein
MAEAPPKHLRAQIRAAFVTLITGKNDDVDDKVHTGRARPVTKAGLPCADVDFGRFPGRPDGGPIDSDPDDSPTRLLTRHPILTLSVTVAHNDGYLDALDAIYADFEPAMAEDNTLGGLVARISPLGEPRVFIEADGETKVARAEMPFEILYVTAFNAPRAAA